MRCIYIGSLNKQTAVTEAGIHAPSKDTRLHRKKLSFYLVEPGVPCLQFVLLYDSCCLFGFNITPFSLETEPSWDWGPWQPATPAEDQKQYCCSSVENEPSFLIVSPGFIGKWLYKESLTSSCTLVYCTMQFKWKHLIARTGLDWVQNITNINTYKQTKIQNSFYSMAMYNSLNMIHLSANYSVALVKYCL